MKKTAYGLIVFWIIVSLCFIAPGKALAQTEDNVFQAIRKTLQKIIWTVFPPPLEIPADMGDTVRDLTPNPDPLNLSQPIIGKPMPNSAGEMDPIVCNGSVSAEFSWWDNLLNSIRDVIPRSRRETNGGWLKGFIANSKSPQVADMVRKPAEENVLYRGDIKDFLCGKSCDHESMKRVEIECVNRGDCNSDDNLKYAGVNGKLAPYLSLNPEREWKQTAIAEREWLLCHTLSGYRRSIFGAQGSIDPYHDYYAGFITAAGPFYVKPQAGIVSRPLYGIEILCVSPLSCANQGISDSEKNTICTTVMGPNYASGTISPTSVLGNGTTVGGRPTPGVFDAAQQAINTPSLNCLMTKGGNCGHFYMLPVVGNEYNPGRMVESLGRMNDYPRDDPDPSAEPDYSDNANRTTTISVPVSAVDSLLNDQDKGIARFFSSTEQISNIGQGSDYAYEIAGCTNPVDVGGTVAVPTGGLFAELWNFWIGLWTPPDAPPASDQGTALAAVDTRGQVLQSFDPTPVNPSPTPISVPAGCIPLISCGTNCANCSGYVLRDGACCPPLAPSPQLITRSETRGIANSRSHSKLVENTRNGALLSCRQFLLPELAQRINEPMNFAGTMIAPKDFPQGETLTWWGDSSGESSTYLPLAGVPPFLWLPTGSLCRDLLVKLYDPEKNPDQAYNAGRWLKEMHDNTAFLSFVENPMAQLLSFQKQNSNLSENRANMLK